MCVCVWSLSLSLSLCVCVCVWYLNHFYQENVFNGSSTVIRTFRFSTPHSVMFTKWHNYMGTHTRAHALAHTHIQRTITFFENSAYTHHLGLSFSQDNLTMKSRTCFHVLVIKHTRCFKTANNTSIDCHQLIHILLKHA